MVIFLQKKKEITFFFAMEKSHIVNSISAQRNTLSNYKSQPGTEELNVQT